MKSFVVVVVVCFVIGACGKSGTAERSGSTAPASGSGSAAPTTPTTPTTASAAAGSGTPSTSPATVEAVLVELERYKNELCACAETSCVDAVTARLEKYRPRVDAAVIATAPTAEQAARIERLDDEMRGCKRWVAAGLGSNSGGGETNAMFEISLVELERHRNNMCGCVDKACGDKVATDHTAWRKKTDAELGDRKPNPSQTERRTTYEKGMAECRSRLK